MRPAASIVALIWLVVAVGLAVSAARPGGLARRTEAVVESFGIGTWVAGTAVFARALMLAAPNDPWPARSAFLLAALLWLWFMPRAIGNLFRLARSRLPPNGIVLLSTVATQAVALVGLRLFPAVTAVSAIAAAMMALGVVCYAVGAFLVLRRYAGGGWTLADDWANGNCILHGALSITGLTAVVSGWFSTGGILALWGVVVAILVIVETIEIARLVVRTFRGRRMARGRCASTTCLAMGAEFHLRDVLRLYLRVRGALSAGGTVGPAAVLRAAVVAYGAMRRAGVSGGGDGAHAVRRAGSYCSPPSRGAEADAAARLTPARIADRRGASSASEIRYKTMSPTAITTRNGLISAAACSTRAVSVSRRG